MFRCWHTDPDERVSFTQLVNLLSQTMESMADYLDVCTFGLLDKQTREEAENVSDDAVGENAYCVADAISNDDVEDTDEDTNRNDVIKVL